MIVDTFAITWDERRRSRRDAPAADQYRFFVFRAVASQKDEKKTFLPRRASQGAPEPGSPHICDFILLV